MKGILIVDQSLNRCKAEKLGIFLTFLTYIETQNSAQPMIIASGNVLLAEVGCASLRARQKKRRQMNYERMRRLDLAEFA